MEQKTIMKEHLQTTGDKCVESSLGWRVEILSAGKLRYQEESRTIELEIEDRPDTLGELEWILYTPATWLWKTDQDQVIEEEKVSDILNRIELALWKLDMKMKQVV